MQRKTSIAAAAILLAAVSACSKPAPAPEATQSAAAASEAAAVAWTAVIPPVGAYESTTSDGKPYSRITLEADNTYLRDPAQGLNEAGIVKLTDGKLCFDPSGKDNPVRCYTTTAPAADASFTVTDDKGVTLTVKPVAK